MIRGAGRAPTHGAAGLLTAYDLPTGKLAWRADSDTDGVVTIAGREDAVYLVGSNTSFMRVGSDVDRFDGFDVASGALPWRLPRGVEVLLAPGAPDVLLGEAGVLVLFRLAR